MLKLVVGLPDEVVGVHAAGEVEEDDVVTDAPWVRRTVQAMGWLIPGEVRVFPDSALDAATSWIAA